MSDVHHFKQTIDGGTLILPVAATGTGTTGGCIIRLTDLPFYNQMGPNFEFARLNKCTIEFWPKANMQLNQFSATGALSTFSPSGTLVTAVDQVPFYSSTVAGGAQSFVQAPSWAKDVSDDAGVTSASFVQCGMTTDYIRGIQGSREKELYKKHKISFYPAFYDLVMSAPGTAGAISSSVNPIPSSSNVNWGLNGCAQRMIKKWISINNISTQANTNALNSGPLYFGPVYAVDANVDGTGVASIPLYDIRLTYSVSFKRVRGI